MVAPQKQFRKKKGSKQIRLSQIFILVSLCSCTCTIILFSWIYNFKRTDNSEQSLSLENLFSKSNDSTDAHTDANTDAHSDAQVHSDDDEAITEKGKITHVTNGRHDNDNKYHDKKYNPSPKKNLPSPISYKVIKNLKFNNTFDVFYKCDLSNRRSTSNKFNLRYTFDFQIQFNTSWNILVMGDSVGIQLAQALQEAGGMKSEDRHVLRYSWRDHEGLHIATGGSNGSSTGAIAGWRITGLLKAKERNDWWQMPPVGGGGWMEIDWRNIKRALYFLTTKNKHKRDTHPAINTEATMATNNNVISSITPSSECAKSLQTVRTVPKLNYTALPLNTMPDDLRNFNCPESDFDVALFQIPFSWFQKPAIDHMSYSLLNETVHLLNTMFGARVIILMNVPITNNLQNIDSEMIPINNIIKNYTDTFTYDTNNDSSNNKAIQAVLLMDMASFSMELFTENAAGLELIDMSSSTLSIQEQLNNQLQYRTQCCHYKFPQIIAFTCAKSVQNMTKDCKRTRYTNDGQHWCMNEVGGRINGVAVCLMKCAHDFAYQWEELKTCEKRCNSQYMTMERISELRQNDYLDNF